MADSCFCVWRVTFGNRASNDYFLAKRTCSIEVASLSEATTAYCLWAKFLQIKQPTKKLRWVVVLPTNTYGSVVHWSFKPNPGATILFCNPTIPPAGSFKTCSII